MLGFWISLPLAAVSLTGVYLGFPQQGRELIGTFTQISPRQGFGRGPSLDQNLKTQEVANLVLAAAPQGSDLVSLDRPGQAGPLWKAQIRDAHLNETLAVLVDDKTREARLDQRDEG